MIYPRLYYTLPFRLRLLGNEMKRNEDEESADEEDVEDADADAGSASSSLFFSSALRRAFSRA